MMRAWDQQLRGGDLRRGLATLATTLLAKRAQALPP